MADLYYGINQTGYSIMNQLSKQIAEGFLDRIDALRFVKDNLFIINPMTGVSCNTDTNKNPIVTTDRVDGKASFILDPKEVPWPNNNRFSSPGGFSSHVFNTEYPKLWEDPTRGLVLREKSIPAAISYDLTLTFQTADAAIRVWDQIKRCILGDVTTFNFDLSYSYPVTTYIFQYFISAWLLRKGYKDVGKSLLEYMNDFAMERISWDFRKSQLGTDHPDMQLFIRRRQLFCQAKIVCDGTGPEEQRKNNAVECYTIPITLQVQFARPFQLIGTMPVVIDNQFVDGKVFETTQVTENENLQATTTSEWQRGFFDQMFPGFRIDHTMMVLPKWDDETFMDPVMQSMYFVPFFQIAFTLDGDVTNLDLKDLGGVGMHPIVRDIILSQIPDIFSFEGLFNIRVYADGIIVDPAQLSLSNDLVLSVKSCGMSRRYHLVISEATKLTYLNSAYYESLLKYRYYFPLTIVRNMTTLVKQGFFTISVGSFLVETVRISMASQKLYDYIATWIAQGITTQEIFQYCCNAAQFADWISNTLSNVQVLTLTTGTPTGLKNAQAYLASLSVGNPLSLYNVFVATALANEELDPQRLPTPYLMVGNGYPYLLQSESHYGLTTPFRILNTRFECQQRT
mgnify:CR=1 FL=1